MIDHVAARLAYLEEELFVGLHINVEEYEPEPGELVWLRPAGIGFNAVCRITGEKF